MVRSASPLQKDQIRTQELPAFQIKKISSNRKIVQHMKKDDKSKSAINEGILSLPPALTFFMSFFFLTEGGRKCQTSESYNGLSDVSQTK